MKLKNALLFLVCLMALTVPAFAQSKEDKLTEIFITQHIDLQRILSRLDDDNKDLERQTLQGEDRVVLLYERLFQVELMAATAEAKTTLEMILVSRTIVFGIKNRDDRKRATDELDKFTERAGTKLDLLKSDLSGFIEKLSNFQKTISNTDSVQARRARLQKETAEHLIAEVKKIDAAISSALLRK